MCFWDPKYIIVYFRTHTHREHSIPFEIMFKMSLEQQLAKCVWRNAKALKVITKGVKIVQILKKYTFKIYIYDINCFVLGGLLNQETVTIWKPAVHCARAPYVQNKFLKTCYSEKVLCVTYGRNSDSWLQDSCETIFLQCLLKL